MIFYFKLYYIIYKLKLNIYILSYIKEKGLGGFQKAEEVSPARRPLQQLPIEVVAHGVFRENRNLKILFKELCLEERAFGRGSSK